ncbi:MAG: ribosome-associated translation inhibitor RaiA [Bryobacter sp.]|jgi:putative sigma-54 modulation protein|nr:ribosome-associated translation inhibitor RaiA [Bryobacter sp. CoA8 C33]
MKIHYTGKLTQINKEQKKNLDNHFAKLGKLVDRRGEREAHVMLTSQRHQQKAEVTMNVFGHQAVGSATHKDQFLALLAAIDKLEKHVQKLHDKRIDGKRHGDGINGKKSPIPEAPTQAAPKTKRLRPTRVQRSAKPLSIEEAPLAIKPAAAYLVFEELGSGLIHVLVRRSESEFDLIEAR